MRKVLLIASVLLLSLLVLFALNNLINKGNKGNVRDMHLEDTVDLTEPINNEDTSDIEKFIGELLVVNDYESYTELFDYNSNLMTGEFYESNRVMLDEGAFTGEKLNRVLYLVKVSLIENTAKLYYNINEDGSSYKCEVTVTLTDDFKISNIQTEYN